jgi:predicted RNA-binding Zn-ribbon protein involved in translation (DUF1610 family)
MTPPNNPPRIPSRDDSGTMTCPVCQARFSPVGRQAYCGTRCRKTAFRRRHQQAGPAVTVPTARPRREITVYECPDCGERLLGEQRCPHCHTFARRVGVGGACPHCDQPVAVTDLIDAAAVTMTAPVTPNRPGRTSGAQMVRR